MKKISVCATVFACLFSLASVGQNPQQKPTVTTDDNCARYGITTSVDSQAQTVTVTTPKETKGGFQTTVTRESGSYNQMNSQTNHPSSTGDPKSNTYQDSNIKDKATEVRTTCYEK